ncbi:MAG TPA: O-antigen ligase family protein [Conexibacter sp.]|nr:O-antigen ligase family protein [Conexibacter sp.]
MPERLRSEGVVLVPALAAVALFVYWGAHGGGYEPTTWQPSALLVLGLLVATVAGLGPGRLRLARPLAAALALLAAYVAFSFLSIAWAPTPGDALDGSNRALLFLLLFALFALLPWRAWTALVTLSAFALGIGAIAVVTLARLGHADQIPALFNGTRLDAPVGYVNGSAALLLAQAVLAIALAARRELPVLLRGLLLALAAAALQLSVLCESRGWLFALPIVLVLSIVLIPGADRLRFALFALLPFGGCALALPPLLDVFEQADAAAPGAATLAALVRTSDHAADVALLVCTGVLVAGLAVAALDRRVRVAPGVARGANRVGAVVALLAVLAGVAAGFALTDGRPDQRIADYWERSNGYQATTPGSSRFAAVGSNRPDFWRVSLKAFAAHPLGGLGQDNWGAYYLRERRSTEQPRWTHSFELRLLAHTGIVGFLLFAGFLATALTAALAPSARRRAGGAAAGIAAAALLPLVVWLVHGSVDWFWEIPALSGPVLAFLALGGALTRQVFAAPIPAEAGIKPRSDGGDVGDRTVGPVPPDPRSRRSPALALGGAALAVAAGLALALPYLAERDVAAAASGWPSDPARAFERLDRAADLNPLSARPDLVAGVIALELRESRVAQTHFSRALERDDQDWFAWFGRGLAASALGDRARARADYRQARRLDPAEPLVREALARLNGRGPLTAREAFTRLRRDVQRLSGSPRAQVLRRFAA